MQGARSGKGLWAVVTGGDLGSGIPWEEGEVWGKQGQGAGTGALRGQWGCQRGEPQLRSPVWPD